jgi:hypothetical protein
MFRVTLEGLKQHKCHAEARVRERYHREARQLRNTYAAAAWAMRKWFRKDTEMYLKVNTILQDLYREFGWKTRVIAPLVGRLVYLTSRREEKRLARGWTYEPKIFCDKNQKMLELERRFNAGLEDLFPDTQWLNQESPATE